MIEQKRYRKLFLSHSAVDIDLAEHKTVAEENKYWAEDGNRRLAAGDQDVSKGGSDRGKRTRLIMLFFENSITLLGLLSIQKTYVLKIVF